MILLIVSLFAKPRSNVNEAQIREIEKSIMLLQDRVSQLETIDEKLNRIAAEQKKLEQFTARLNQLEASSSQRINRIAKKLAALQKILAAAGTKPPTLKSTPKPVPKPAAKPSPRKPATRFHQVSSGETLYSISRRYGIPIDTLLKLNNFAPGTKIYPGQKISLGSSGGR
jgi:membrane-bound lytic murein transglycosylase D